MSAEKSAYSKENAFGSISPADCNVLRSSESGNIFFTLFGAIAIVGLLGTVIVSTIRGPLTTMVEVQNRAKAEAEMTIASRLAMIEAAQLESSGDCDGDGFVEPPEYDDAAGQGPMGGGFLPSTVASSRVDPWGTKYGYCTWDAGSIANSTGCDTSGNETNERLDGNGSATDEGYSVIAIISAGPDQKFDTTCIGGDTPSISKNGDDAVVQYTYAQARTTSDGLWNLKSGDPNTAEIAKDLDVKGSASFSAGIDLTGSSAALELGAASLMFPDQDKLETCNSANEGLIRVNTSSNPDQLEICDMPTGWVAAGGSGLWNPGSGQDIYYNPTGTPRVGIGTDSPSEALEVDGSILASGNFTGANLIANGDASITGTLDVGGATTLTSLHGTGAADFDSTLNADGATTLGSTLGVSGAATLSSTLDVTGAADLNSTLDVSGAATLSSTLDVTGAADLNSTLDVSGATDLGSTLDVTGATTLASTLDVQGDVSNSTGDVTVDDDLNVTGDIDGTDITASSDLIADATVIVNGDQLGPPLNCDSDEKLEWNDGVGWSCEIDLQGGSGGGVPTLDDLSDVTISSVADEECLTYDSVSSEWINGPCGGSSVFEVTGSAGSELVRSVDAVAPHDTSDFLFGSAQLADAGNASEDARMFFDKSKGAFRAGSVTGTEWDDANVGANSIGMGMGTASGSGSIALGAFGTVASGGNSIALGNGTASGTSSVVIGSGNTATANSSVAIGDSNDATGQYSLALGYNTNATGTNSLSAGYLSTASGISSIAAGYALTSAGDYSIALGREVATTASGDGSMAIGLTTTAMATDAVVSGAQSLGIFMGNQTGYDLVASNRMALVGGDFLIDDAGATGDQGCIRYDGGNSVLQFSNDCITFYDMTGSNSSVFEVAGGTGTERVRTVNVNAPYATSDFIFGSPQLGDDADSDHFNRMLYDKSKGAFRVGSASGAQWDDGNIGTGSIGIGSDVTATGIGSIAMGSTTISSGLLSTASGYQTNAAGDYSNAFGNQLTISSTGDGSAGFGLTTTSPATDPIISGSQSFALFMGNHSAVNFAANNTFGLFGGNMVIDPNIPATQLTARSVLDLGAATDSVVMPLGTTAQRPGSPVNGMIRYNSDNGKFEAYQQNLWQDILTSGTGNEVALSSIRDAVATNSIDSDNFAQVWNWNTLTTETALQLASSSQTTGTILNLTGSNNNVASTGTVASLNVTGTSNAAVPLRITNAGTGLSLRINDDGTTTDATPVVVDAAGALVVGSATARAALDVNGGDIVVSGTYTGAGSAPVTGAGTRMFFDVSRSAFRAGSVTGTEWDTLGLASVALGYNTTATGATSVAIGDGVTASGASSLALGDGATVSGDSSIGLGSATVSGDSSFASGNSTVSGDFSVAIGAGNIVSGNHNYALGRLVEITANGSGSLGLTTTQPATLPIISGNQSYGIFLGNHSGTTFAATNTMGLFGGSFVIDPNVPATQFTARGVIDVGASTGSVVLPRGTVAQRPGTPTGAMFRYNTDSTPNDTLEYYDAESAAWRTVTSSTGTGGALAIDDLSDAISNTTSTVFLGTGSGTVSTGTGNTGVGINALASNVGKKESTAVGLDAMRYADSAGVIVSYNTAIGAYALRGSTTATNNTGVANTAVGHSALYSNTTGTSNVAVGSHSFTADAALYANTVGNANTAVGQGALTTSVATSRNTAVGNDAMRYANSTSSATDTYNTAFGYQALRGSTTAADNTGIGNTAVGARSLVSNTSGSANVAIGSSDGTLAGALALNLDGSNNVSIGTGTMASNQSGSQTTVIGTEAMRFANTSTTPFTTYNTAIGYQALRGSIVAVNNTGTSNTALGHSTLLSNTTGSQNVAIGASTATANAALYSNTTGYNNVAIGTSALASNTAGFTNTAVGLGTLQTNVAGNQSTAMGYEAMRYANSTAASTTTYNTAVGYQALRGTASSIANIGTSNTALGHSALLGTSSGSGNTAVGVAAGNAGTANVSGSNNTYLGYNAQANANNYDNSTAVGHGATITASNQMVFGDSSLSTAIFSGTGAVRLPNGTTAQQPTGAGGMIRYNTDSTPEDTIEYYDAQTAAWITLAGDDGGASDVFEVTGAAASELVRQVAANAPYATADFLFGSGQLADAGNATEDARMFFDKSKGAFRAGTVTSTQWDDANVGTNSFAIGNDTRATGSRSAAFGFSTLASGADSFALGQSTTASGASSIAAGTSATASGSSSTALGSSVVASGNYSLAVGYTATAGAQNAIAMGDTVSTSATYSLAIGQNLAIGSFASGAMAFGKELNFTGVSTNSVGFGLNTAGSATDPIISGAESFGIFMGDHSGVTFSAAKTLGLFGGTMVIDPNNPATQLTARGVLDVGASTGAIVLPRGTTAQQPGTPTGGMFRYNTTSTPSDTLEYYDAETAAWLTLAEDDGGASDVFEVTGGAGTELVRSINANAPHATSDFLFGSAQLADAGNASEDNRMYFDKSAGAFRAGGATGTEWDTPGDYSFAVGYNTIANGDYSTSLGSNSYAVGDYSFAAGTGASAYGNYAMSFGLGSGASGNYSLSFGREADVSGSASMAVSLSATTHATDPLVSGTEAFGIFMGDQSGVDFAATHTMGLLGGSLVIDPNAPATQLTARGVIDVGASTSAIVLPRGTTAQQPGTPTGGMFRYNTTSTPSDTLEYYDAETAAWLTLAADDGGASDVFEVTGGAGTELVRQVAANAPYATSDFLFGSAQMADAGNATEDSRMFFDKSKSAFRVGIVDGTQWDNANVGDYSVAMGYNATASGEHSVAIGPGNAASALLTFAIGEDNVVNADRSAALGFGSTASGEHSFSIGSGTVASGDYSTALGYGVSATGLASMAMGNGATADGLAGTAMGSYTIADGDYSSAFGNSVTIDTTGDGSVAFGALDGNPSGTPPIVSGAESFAVFMGDHSGVDFTPARTMGVFGGNIVVDPNEPATQVTARGVIDVGASTGAIVLPRGTTAQQPGTPTGGMFRYNTTSTPSDTLEYYDAETAAWVTLAASGTALAIDDLTDGISDTTSTVFLGTGSGAANTGTDNTAVGINTLATNVARTGSTAVGFEAMRYADSTAVGAVSYNTALGYQALRGSATAANNTGSANTALGYATLWSNTSGASNIAIGVNAMSTNSTGTGNTSIGNDNLGNNTTGGYNVALGNNALRTNVAGNESVAIGYLALRYANNTGSTFTSYNTAVGANALTGSSTPANNTGTSNTAIGHSTLLSNTSGYANVAIGTRGSSNSAAPLEANTTGSMNIAIGSGTSFSYAPLSANTTGNYNIAFGVNSLASNTVGYQNIAIGIGSLGSNVAGRNTVAIGYEAMLYANSSSTGFNTFNTALGYQALRGSVTAANNTGTSNTAIGHSTLLGVTSGAGNTALGVLAGNAGTANTTGSNNTYIGYNAQANANNYDNSTALGYGAIITASNQMSFGNTSVTNAKFNGTGAVTLPNGTVAQRPTGAGGMIRYNTDSTPSDTIEYYDAETADWITLVGDDGSSSDVFEVTGGAGTELVRSVDANAPHATADFLFGSAQLDDAGNADEDVRMFFDKSKGSFRAGSADSTQWDDANVGSGSFAGGANTIASGDFSSALGTETTASGDLSFAFGEYSTADGFASLAFGSTTTASGGASIAGGDSSTASGDVSFAFGSAATASGDLSFALGTATTAAGDDSIALGRDVTVSGTGDGSMALGLTTTSPAVIPIVSGAESLGIFLNDQSSMNVTASNVMAVLGGNVLINPSAPSDTTVTPLSALHVVGDIRHTGIIIDASDIRYKTDIKYLPEIKGNLLDRLAQIKGYQFRMKENTTGQLEYGVIAQEVERVFPELVVTDNSKEKMKSVNYIGLIAPLIEATKELKAENDALKMQMARYDARLAALEGDMDDIKLFTGFGISKASMGLLGLLALLTMSGIFIVIRRKGMAE